MESDTGSKKSRSSGDIAKILKQAARCFNIGRYPIFRIEVEFPADSKLSGDQPEVDEDLPLRTLIRFVGLAPWKGVDVNPRLLATQPAIEPSLTC